MTEKMTVGKRGTGLTGEFRRKYYIRYTLIFCAAALAVYIQFILKGKSFLWVSDGTDQHYTALVWFGQYLRDYVSGIFSGKGFALPQWSFQIGMGDDILTTLHYYCIGDPLDLLAAFFGPKSTEGLYTVLILLRLYLAGAAFSEFCFYHKKNKIETGYSVLTGALVYCFCGFIIAGAMKHAFFFNPFLYFPLYCLGTEKLLKKESPKLFILITALCAFSNFYFFYMMTAMVFLYAAVRFFGIYKKGEWGKNFFRLLARGIGCYALGVGMAAVIFMPVVLRFLNNPRYAEAAGKLKDAYSVKYLGRMLMSFSGPPLSAGYWNFLGFASVAFAAVILLFASKWKKNAQLKVFFILGVLMLAIPYAGYALNGFAYVTNRWLFAFDLLVAYICVEMIPELKAASGKKLLAVLAGAGAVFAGNLYGSIKGYRTELFGLSGILLLIILLVVYRKFVSEKPVSEGKKEQIYRGGIVAVTVLSVAVNANYHYKNMTKQFADAGTYYENVQEEPLAVLAGELDDSEFYRIDGYLPDSKRTADRIQTDTSMESMMQVFTGMKDQMEAQEDDDTLGDTQVSAGETEDTEGTGETGDTPAAAKSDEKPIRSYNSAMLTGYNGLSEYFSLMNPWYMRFVISEDIASANFSVKIASMDKRPALNALAGVRYLIAADIYNMNIPYGYREIKSHTSESGITGTLYENEYALPLGFTYDTYLPEAEFEEASGVRRQQLMLESVFLEEAPEGMKEGTSKAGLKKAEFVPEPETAVIREEGKLKFVNRKDWIVFDTDVPEGSEVYLYIKNARFRGSGYAVAAAAADNSLQQCVLYGKSKRDYFGRKDILMNLGYYEDGLSRFAFTMSEIGTLKYDDFILFYFPAADYAEKVQERAKEPLTDIGIGVNSVTGTVTADQDKVLFLSIPYTRGFKAEVNGIEVPVVRANGMYMAIPVNAGENAVSLTYSTPGLRAGAAVSAVSILIFIAGSVVFRRRKKHFGGAVNSNTVTNRNRNRFLFILTKR